MVLNIEVDSRKIKKGDTFIALRGISSDGHDYIDKAIENGASKLIVEEKGNYNIPYEVVKDTRKYLVNYLKENYGKYINELKLVGFTGTNGKTTSAFLLYTALNDLNIKTSYIGTVGFYIEKKISALTNTTPDILELYKMLLTSYEEGCKYVCMEVSSQGLSYNRLEGLEFDYAIFTNLTQDHLDYHKTMENYALAKQQLFKKIKPNGTAIVNYDDNYKDYYLLENNNNVTYGFNGGDYKIDKYIPTNLGTIISYTHNNSTYNLSSLLIGKYNTYNLLTTIVVLDLIGIGYSSLKKTIEVLKAPIGRMETIIYNNNSIVIDYAHTPDAVEKIITTMKEVTKGNIYTIFGCTGDRDRTKRPIMMKLVTDLSKYVIVTSDDLHNEDPKQIVNDMLKENKNNNFEVIMDRGNAIKKGISLLKENDTLLILGKGHEEYIIVGDNKIPFQDFKVVQELIEGNRNLVK
ncbi:MAG: UDP-N-acetylmuramoyl-L-alanyl-D-glutamate--2,6-diaminopimelate ligase [Clostridium sp.]|nr:UDP-N-acetylmuramoyl-L-alanyl-D-glutamate--2,6-diaminopimelate ligase [Clostridium sp.]MCM1444647.1 UDP-N-acetylmuramoyl-L-alanyl-D-glutamate--2,6-diaminopimelate ligase [Candidatus Amulumruptor caecigallinarius]